MENRVKTNDYKSCRRIHADTFLLKEFFLEFNYVERKDSFPNFTDYKVIKVLFVLKKNGN